MNLPKDSRSRHWTNHVKGKMLFYRLSESRILRVLRSPTRQDVGIAPKTSAFMQRNDTSKRKEEIWVLVQQIANSKEQIAKSGKTIIISAWRYPGVSKPGATLPMPQGLADEIERFIKNEHPTMLAGA